MKNVCYHIWIRVSENITKTWNLIESFWWAILIREAKYIMLYQVFLFEIVQIYVFLSINMKIIWNLISKMLLKVNCFVWNSMFNFMWYKTREKAEITVSIGENAMLVVIVRLILINKFRCDAKIYVFRSMRCNILSFMTVTHSENYSQMHSTKFCALTKWLLKIFKKCNFEKIVNKKIYNFGT